ncbi:MAG: zinc ribbon domain-containing protein [Candidatus Thorarchaeota archaeon]
MSERPTFLSVQYSGSGLSTMSYERKMVREDDVKFDGEDGILELTDVRLVWYKKPKKSRFGGLKKIGAVAGALAGAAILEGVGGQIGGIGGRALRGVGRGLAYGAVGAAVYSWTADNFYNRGPNGETESLAIPLIAIANAQQSGKELIIDLKSGGNLRFEFKQSKVIPSVTANITQAQNEGKCPYCGHVAGNATTCPNCGASINPGGAGGAAGAPAGSPSDSVHISVHEEDGVRRATVTSADGTYHVDVHEGGGGGGYCPNCGSPVPAGAKFCNNCGQRL